METVGVLHPGHMGVALAAAMQGAGAEVLWASQDRSAKTRQRAENVGLTEVATVDQLVADSSIVLSICPPEAAVEVAESVGRLGFEGLFVDGNAVSPRRMADVVKAAGAGGADVVDGSVIGGPPWTAGTTRLYLSGEHAQRFAQLFEGSPCEARVLGGGVGKASALKMSFAAYTKGRSALEAACMSLADAHGLLDELKHEWELGRPGRVAETERQLAGSAPKAWRFAGEMELIAATFAEAGLPGEFHQAARIIWERWAHHRGEEGATPPVERMVKELRE